jgi:hypothetical protein
MKYKPPIPIKNKRGFVYPTVGVQFIENIIGGTQDIKDCAQRFTEPLFSTAILFTEFVFRYFSLYDRAFMVNFRKVNGL